MPPKSSTTSGGFDSREMTTTTRMSSWQKKNVKTHIVSSKSKLVEQRSIMGALAQASPYDRIEIEGGEYHELVSVTFPIEIVGTAGDHPVIVSRGTGFQTASECDCYVEGITFENRSKDGEDFAIVCAMGSPIFVNCKLSNASVVGSSKPTFSSCDISDSANGIGVRVQCLVATGNTSAPSPTFDNCKIGLHYRTAVVVDGVGTHLSALFHQCRINQVVGATAVACIEGVASTSVPSKSVVFQENQISYKKSALNDRGEVEMITTPGVQTDYRYSAGVGGVREPAAMWIGGCSKYLKLVDNDFSDGAVGLYLERGASPTIEGNKVRRMTSCGMRIAVGARGVGDHNHEINCGAQFERCAVGIDVVVAAEMIKPACQSPGAEEVGLLRPAIINELDQVAVGNAGAVPSHKWHDRLHTVAMDLTAKCNIPSGGGGSGFSADATARTVPNWDVVQALAKMHHTDLGTPTGDTDAAVRETVTTFLQTAAALHSGQLSLASKNAAPTTSRLPGAVHITQAKLTDCQKHGIRFAPGSYGLLSYCSFDSVSHGAAILVEHDAFPVIVNCRFSSSGRHAVECHRSSQALFVHNIISNGMGDTAIWMRPGSEGTFIDNKIEFNSGFGAIIEGAATPTFFRNQFASNQKGGVLIRDHARPTLDRNCFKANKRHIVVSSYSNPKISCNDIFNGDVGISFNTCAIGTVVGNAVFDNSEAGILIETDADPRVEHNFLVRNAGHGVVVKDNGTGTLTSNLLVANSQYGISVTTGGDPVCRGNTIGINTVGGIWVGAEGLGLFEKNDVFSNQLVGNIHLSGKHTNPVFDKNRIWRARGGGGVVCDEGAAGHFKRNTIVCNGGCGVALFRGCVTLFEHNRIESQLIGVCASLCGGGIIRKNKICFNGRCGVFIDQLGAPEIADNAIDQNYVGLELRMAPAGLVKHNSFEGNVFGSVSGQTDALPNCVHEAGERIGLSSLAEVRKYAKVQAAMERRPSVANVVLGKAAASRHQQPAAAVAGGGGATAHRGAHHPSHHNETSSSSSSKPAAAENDEQQQTGSSRSRSRPTSAADGRVDTTATCLVTENHLSFNAVCGVALVLCASGHYEKNSIVGNAFCGVYVTARRAFEMHHLANTAFLKECHFNNAVELLAAHSKAPNFANEFPSSGVFGDTVMEANVISLHTHAGVFVELWEQNTEIKFVINEIHQNAMGIRIGTAARAPGLTFEENDVTKNVVGLHISGTGSPSATFEDNLFDHNSFAGAILGGDCRPLFKRNNVFSNSRYFGAWVVETAAPAFQPGNVFSDNVVAGVAVQQGGTTAAHFNACVFKHNDRFGVFAYSFEAHPKFDGNGQMVMPKAGGGAGAGGGGALPTRGASSNKITSTAAAAHAAAPLGSGHHHHNSAASMSGRNADASNSVSVFKNCIIRNNGLVGVFVGALSKEFSDDLNARGSIRTSALVTRVSQSDTTATEKVLENFAAFTGDLGETVTATDVIQGGMSSPQTREREGAAEAVTHNAGPMALPNEAPRAGGGGSSNSSSFSSRTAGGGGGSSGDGKGLAGRPPHQGFVRGGTILLHQCAIKANRLGALVDRNADPVFYKTVFAGNLSAGIVLSPGSIACINENVVESNALCGIVACPQAKSVIIGCEVLENNKADLLELAAGLDERMHPIGGVTALVSLDTVKFCESDLSFSPSRWSTTNSASISNNNNMALGYNAEALVKKSVAGLAMAFVGVARADSRMAHRSAHHFATPSKFRLSPGCLFSSSLKSSSNNSGGGDGSNLATPTNPRARQHSNIVTVHGVAASTTDQLMPPSSPSSLMSPADSSFDGMGTGGGGDAPFGTATFDPSTQGVPTAGRGPMRARSRSMVMIKTMSSTNSNITSSSASNRDNSNNGDGPSASYMPSQARHARRNSSDATSTSRGVSDHHLNTASNNSFDVNRLAKFRLNSLVHGVGVWVEEGSDCEITHNTVFGHVNAGVLITTEGLTSDARGNYESEMMAQTQATVAPGDRYSSALQEALAFVAGGVEVSATTLHMNLIHHNRGVGVRILAAASPVVDGLIKLQKVGGGGGVLLSAPPSSSMKQAHHGSRASKAAKDAKNDLLDPAEIVDAPGCTTTTSSAGAVSTSVHPILRYITNKHAGLTVPALGSVNVGVMDRVLCADDVIGGANDDAAKRSLARLTENEIEFNSNGGLLVEFVLCSAAAVVSSSMDASKRSSMMDFAGDSLVAPTRVVNNTFRCNGKTGSVVVRSAVQVDMLNRGSGGLGWAASDGSCDAPDEFYINSLVRASSIPGLCRVSDFYMPVVIESNTFVDPPRSEHRDIVRAPCISLLGYTSCNVRANEFSNVTSGCAIVVARDVISMTMMNHNNNNSSSSHDDPNSNEPRSDSIDPAQVSSGVIIGPDNTFEGNHFDVAVSGTGLSDCAVVGNVFKGTTGVCVLTTGGARPLVLANRFHGQRFYDGGNSKNNSGAGGRRSSISPGLTTRQQIVSSSNPTSDLYEPVKNNSTCGAKQVVTNADNLLLKATIGKAWEKIIAPPLHGPVAAVTSTSPYTAPWVIGNQFDGNQVSLRVTEHGGTLATLNVFSANVGSSVVIDDASEAGGAVIERNLFCNMTESSAKTPVIVIAGEKGRAVIRRNLFRDILDKKTAAAGNALSAAASHACAIRVGDGASPWIDSNGFQDVGVALLLQSPGGQCAVSRNAFFRCFTGVQIGGERAPSTPLTEAGAASSSSSSSSSPSSAADVLKSVTSDALACLSHNAFECPFGTGVLVSGALASDAAAVNSNVFLSTPVLAALGGNQVACLKNIFVGASITGLSDAPPGTAMLSPSTSSGGGDFSGEQHPSSSAFSSSSPSSPSTAVEAPPVHDTALQFRNGSRSVFFDNFVLGSRTGLLTSKGAEAVVMGGTFFKCSTALDLTAEKAAKVLVDSCTILAAQSIALRLASGAVKRCKVFKSGGAFAVDFCATNSQAYSTMSECEVACSDADAIRFAGSGCIEGCHVSLAKHGVKFLGGAVCVSDVRRSNIMDVDRVGVLFQKGNNGALMDCDVFDCGICGVALEEAASGDVEGCRISSVLDHGAVDMETATRVTMRNNTIRNQFSPSHKGKLAGARQKETVARVNKELEEAGAEEEKALSNAKWAVSLRERLLGELDDVVKKAQEILFDAQNNHRNHAGESGGGSGGGAGHGMGRRNSSSSNLPGVTTTSPSRLMRNDRGFELSNIIAAKKTASGGKLAADQPVPRSSNNKSAASSAANSRPSSSGPASRSTSSRRGSLSATTTTQSMPQQPKPKASSTNSRRASRVHEEALPSVATRKTASSIAKETEADQTVARLVRGAGHYASEHTVAGGSSPQLAKIDTSSSHLPSVESPTTTSTTNATSSPPSVPAESKAKAGAAGSRSTSRRGSTAASSALPPISPSSPAASPTFTAPTAFSRVLLHQVGDAEGTPYVAQVSSMLEETLGGRCLIMKTSSSDPIEAMLGAAACSHVVVVYPTFPMKKRATASDEKALLALSCYVEMSLREKEKRLMEKKNVDSDADSASSRPGTPASALGKAKMDFSGAWSVVQPPPAGGSGDVPVSLGDTLPPVRSPGGGADAATMWSPSKGQLRLPATFKEVQGVPGLYQALTGRKAPRGGAGGGGDGDKPRRRRTRQVQVIG